MALELIRTDSSNPAFIALVQLLDAELAARDGHEHAFYHQFNGIIALNHVALAYLDNEAVACGAFKELEPGIVEIKRMYTKETVRGQGIASALLQELENWAFASGYTTLMLETGKRQPEAIALYEKNGYHIIPNYGQYAGIENSVCFAKYAN